MVELLSIIFAKKTKVSNEIHTGDKSPVYNTTQGDNSTSNIGNTYSNDSHDVNDNHSINATGNSTIIQNIYIDSNHFASSIPLRSAHIQDGQFGENVKKFNCANSSISGLLIIYACSLAFKNRKNFPATLIGNPYYVHGYITALEISADEHFRAIGLADMTINVSNFDEQYFGDATNKEYILSRIKSNGGYAQALISLQDINKYFGVD